MPTQVKIFIVIVAGVILIPWFGYRNRPADESKLEWIEITITGHEVERHTQAVSVTYFVAEDGYKYVFLSQHTIYDQVGNSGADALMGQTLEVLVSKSDSTKKVKSIFAWKSNGHIKEYTLDDYNRASITDFWVLTGIYLFFSVLSFMREFIDICDPLFSKIDRRKITKARKRNAKENAERKKRYHENRDLAESETEYIHSQKNISRKKLKRRAKK